MGVLGDVWESYFGNEEVQRLSMVRRRRTPKLVPVASLADACPRRAAQGLARSVALFTGSVVLMRQFGDLMAI